MGKSAPEKLAISSFSTDALPPGQRHEAWQNRGWPTIGPVFHTDPTGPFFNRSDRFLLGELVVHVSEMGGQVYRRDAALIRRDDLEDVIVSIPVLGHMRGTYAGQSVLNGPGLMVATDLARPHEHISTDSRTIVLTVPRVRLARAGIRADGLHGRAATGHHVDLLRSHVETIYRNAARLTGVDGSSLGESVLGLMRLALTSPDDMPIHQQEGAEHTILLQAREVIARHLACSQLDAAFLCRVLRVSRSALYRAFEPHGGVSTFIRERRLDQAREELRVADPHLTIAGVGERVGFVDPAHFSRAFRLRFGVSPRDWRAAADPPQRDG